MPGRSIQLNLSHTIGSPIVTTRLSEQALVVMPPRHARFTINEWKLNNDQMIRSTQSQQQLANHVIDEIQRVIDETSEKAKIQKDTVDRRLEERIGDVEFNKDELEKQRQEINSELEALGMYKARMLDAIASIENSQCIVRKCVILRDGRLGIDLVADNVDDALQREMIIADGALRVLKRTLEQLQEQMRRIRATRYLLDRDLYFKQGAIDIDKMALELHPNKTCLSIYEGLSPLDPANISSEEYNLYSRKNITNAAKEVNSARPIRDIINTVLRQVTDDLCAAYKNCNHEFNNRIRDTKIAKGILEDMHRETVEKLGKINESIIQLKKALTEKESHVGLAHTRLGRRAQRGGAELVRDGVSQALYNECETLRGATEHLQLMMHEAEASRRYLLQSQLKLEEDINIKMNTLKIDEVDCMTLHETMNYNFY